MSRLELVAPARLPRAELVQLFNHAYSDYFVPAHLDPAGFDTLAAWCDLDLESSRVARLGGVTAGVVLLGVRGERGWIGGMGVLPEARGHGLGAELMRSVIASARALGLRTLALEVLVQNAPAIRIYNSLGFQRIRGLEVWVRDGSVPSPPLPRLEIASLTPADALAVNESFRTSPLPWQRGRESLERSLHLLGALGSIEDRRVAGALL